MDIIVNPKKFIEAIEKELPKGVKFALLLTKSNDVSEQGDFIMTMTEEHFLEAVKPVVVHMMEGNELDVFKKQDFSAPPFVPEEEE